MNLQHGDSVTYQIVMAGRKGTPNIGKVKHIKNTESEKKIHDLELCGYYGSLETIFGENLYWRVHSSFHPCASNES